MLAAVVGSRLTLILTLANASAIYQASDYQLTDGVTGRPLSDAGAKQLGAHFKGLDVRVAFTGIASVAIGAGRRPTIAFLADEIKAMAPDSSFEDVCASLATVSTEIVRPYGPKGVLTLIVTATEIGRPARVAEISNMDWRGQKPQAEPHFRTAIHTIVKPFALISGFRRAVSKPQQHRLRGLARDTTRPHTQVLEVLRQINAAAAKRSHGWISEGCWLTSQLVESQAIRSTAQNIGAHAGGVPILIGGLDITEFVLKNFEPAPGQQIRLLQSASVSAGPGGGTPLPLPSGEPREIAFAGSAASRSLYGAGGNQGLRVRIDHPASQVATRLNEQVTVPLSTVRLETFGATSDCPRPKAPWPQLPTPLTIDGVTVPRGWEYSVVYWVSRGAHRVEILQTSRSIRNIAFLKADEELVVVVPSESIELSWRDDEQVPQLKLTGRVWWKSRGGGTLG